MDSFLSTVANGATVARDDDRDHHITTTKRDGVNTFLDEISTERACEITPCANRVVSR
jgi:hypothetical protein